MDAQTTEIKIPMPEISKFVIYALEGTENEGKARPAVITEVHEGSPTSVGDNSPLIPLVNLQVFLDGTNDATPGGRV